MASASGFTSLKVHVSDEWQRKPSLARAKTGTSGLLLGQATMAPRHNGRANEEALQGQRDSS
jgi:hypothetical protein